MISLTPLLVLLCFFLTYSSSSSPVSITITPKILSKSGDSVHVEWSGIESPSKLDWLGIYSPSNSSDDNFIGYVLLSTCKNWQSGSCSIDLPLVNLRSSYEFRIFHWSSNEKMRNWSITHDTGDDNPLLPGITYQMAKSEELRFQTGRGPEQIHLAFTMNDDEMRVMFVTEDGKENYVKYGEEEVEMDEVAETGVRRYEQLDMCDSPANESIGWRDPGFIHDGVMKNLKRGKRYYYNVGSSAGGWSETHSFVSRDQDSNETLAFLFGDMGTATPYSTFRRTQEESKSTVKWITRDIKALGDKPTFISHIGDISYARGYSWLWDTFFTQIEPIASKVPYHVCIGNHEYDWPLQPWKPDWAQKIYNKDGGGECGVPYSLRFNMPSNCSVPTGTHSPATQNLYYSFHVGVVHFLYMSTETNFLPGSDQYSFIKQDLEGIDRKKTPFVVVQGHRPMYTSSSNSKDGPLRERMIKHLEPLFVKNKVTLALWGHVHRYERFCPMKNFTCGGRGTNGGEGEDLPVHVVIGMGGQDWQPIWAPLSDEPKHPIFPQPHQSLFRASEFGYTRLVATKEKLTLTYIGNHDGKPHDMVEIPASDPVLYSGFDSKKQESPGLNGGNSDVRGGSMVTESESPWYVKLGVIILVGAFLGFVHGLVSDFTKKATSRTSWILMESEEV